MCFTVDNRIVFTLLKSKNKYDRKKIIILRYVYVNVKLPRVKLKAIYIRSCLRRKKTHIITRIKPLSFILLESKKKKLF